MMETPDFKNIDGRYDFKNYEERLRLAKKLGYCFVSEAAYKLHFENKVYLTRISHLLGYKGDAHMYIFFRKMGWPTNSVNYRDNFQYGGKKPDFEMLDKTMRIAYYPDKIELIRKLGYTYLHEAVYDLYYNQEKSFSQMSTMVGYFQGNSLQALFRKLNWPRRPRGGANYGAAISSKKDEIYQKWIECDDKKNAVCFCKRIAKEYGCSVSTIKGWVYRDGWKYHSFEKK